MGLAFTSIVRTGTLEYTYSWTGPGPYRFYLDGKEIYAPDGDAPSTVTSLSLRSSDSLEPPALEVIDTSGSEVAQNLQFSPLLVVQWRGDTNTDYYSVEQYVGAAWVVQKRIAEDGKGYYKYTTTDLDDATTSQFRVIGYDLEGYTSTAYQVDHIVVRNPDPPSITMTYAAGTGLVTIAAR